MEEVLQKALNKEFEKYIYTLKHEIKNPVLAQIQAISHLLNKTDDNITPLQKELLTLTLDSCHKQCSIINTIIETYRFKTKSIKLKHEKTNLYELFTQVAKEFPTLKTSINLNTIKAIIPADKIQLNKAFKIIFKLVSTQINNKKEIKINLTNRYNNSISLNIKCGLIPKDSTNLIAISNVNEYNPIGAIAEKELLLEIIKNHNGEIQEIYNNGELEIKLFFKNL